MPIGTSHSSDLSLELSEKCGWLLKWTNYIKGYRQRWFVLDSCANLSYYRNSSEVGQSCRGSINLQEARIHADKATNSLTISAPSQTFHLKAQNELDHDKWFHALECARHRAVRDAESDEDDDIKMSVSGNSGAAAIETMNRAIAAKIFDLRTCSSLISKHGSELLKAMSDLEKTGKIKALAERINLFKITTAAMMKACEEFVTLTAEESKKVGRYAANEHEQRLRLQDQLEELAQQHSKLERVAYRSTHKGSVASEPPFLDAEEEFHDAYDYVSDMHDDGRKSSSSQTESIGEVTNSKLFNAEIIYPKLVKSETRLTRFAPTIQHSRQRRTKIPERPQTSISLWSIMRNCIGKELSKIPMPVNFNEPLSVLQRISEDLEYSYLLDEGAEKADSLEQMCYVAAFAVSAYSTTGYRTTKPFNPLLGETFECNRFDDLGWRSFAEQVSHHPPITAHHADGRKWTLHQDFSMTSRFRGKYLSVTPVGYTYVKFLDSGNEYSYKKVTTTVHNIIVGKLWIDNHGEMLIENHKTGDKCILKFHPYSYFSREPPRKIAGFVKNPIGEVHWLIQGIWDSYLDILKVTNEVNTGENARFETDTPNRIWTINSPIENSEKMYYFTKLAIELNEPEEGVAPTDSRLRPDQRLMEDGKWNEANEMKVKIEEKQRAVRREREILAQKALQKGEPFEEYKPLWFKKDQHEETGALIHVFTGEYWKMKKIGDWSKCPSIF
uniref:Oxysterol-binding protein n=2 Tax=Wuchereria bancrofti TaxID=6293 RepID=A0A1I8ETP1_WUCBA